MHLELILSSPFAHAAPVKRLPPNTPASRERSGTWGHPVGSPLTSEALSGAEGPHISLHLPSLNMSWFLLWWSHPGGEEQQEGFRQKQVAEMLWSRALCRQNSSSGGWHPLQ